MSERIGVIGLGLMGRPIACNLAASGYEVIIHNRSHGVVHDLCRDYPVMTPASNPADVARQANIVITILPTPADVERVVLGVNGVLAGIQRGGLVIDMSTSPPELAIRIDRALRDTGASALDAPVSGGDKGAIEGTLSIMAGGEPADFERARPVLECLGKTIVHCGDVGAGQTVKACNQIVVGIAYQAVSEALVLGSKAGVDPRKIVEVLNGGLAATGVLKLRGDAMIKHDFQPGGRSELHLKDLGIALEAGKRLNVPLPITAFVAAQYQTLAARGQAHLDHSALLKLAEEAANHWIAEAQPVQELRAGTGIDE